MPHYRSPVGSPSLPPISSKYSAQSCRHNKNHEWWAPKNKDSIADRLLSKSSPNLSNVSEKAYKSPALPNSKLAQPKFLPPLKSLEQIRAEIEQKERMDATTELLKQLDWGNKDASLHVIKSLIEDKGADLRALDIHGTTVLFNAVFRNIHNNYQDLDILEYLLKVKHLSNLSDNVRIEHIAPCAVAEDYDIEAHKEFMILLSKYEVINLESVWCHLPKGFESYERELLGTNESDISSPTYSDHFEF